MNKVLEGFLHQSTSTHWKSNDHETRAANCLDTPTHLTNGYDIHLSLGAHRRTEVPHHTFSIRAPCVIWSVIQVHNAELPH